MEELSVSSDYDRSPQCIPSRLCDRTSEVLHSKDEVVVVRDSDCSESFQTITSKGRLGNGEQLQYNFPESIYNYSTLQIEDKASIVLDSLPAGSRVAFVTMVGSLCPVTLGHVASFIEARKILLGFDGVPRPARLEHFDACIGFLRLNSDGHVRMKMQQKGDHFLKATERGHLIKLATRTYNWLGLSSQSRSQEEMIRLWPQLRFVKFSLNGADDVAKYRKWSQASRAHRLITMGRPGDTEKVLAGMRKSNVDQDDGFFIMGPELPNISSTRLRRLLRRGQTSAEELGDLVDAAVGEWCIQKWRKEGWSDVANTTTQDSSSI